MKQLPGMARIHEEYKDKGVELLALNIIPQYSSAEFLAYMKQYKGGDHFYATDTGQQVAVAYQIQYLGETRFIDREGNIAGKAFPPGVSYEELKQAVDQLLQ